MHRYFFLVIKTVYPLPLFFTIVLVPVWLLQGIHLVCLSENLLGTKYQFFEKTIKVCIFPR